MPGDWDDARFARDTCQAALSLMHRHGIPATPENYAVWYTYCAENDRDLTRAVDALITAGSPFTPEQNAQLYERFFGNALDSHTVEATSKRLEAAMDRIINLVGQAGRDTKAYGRRLADLSGEIADGESLEEVQATIRELLLETRSVLIKNKQLEERLSKSTKAVSELREDLENVRQDALTDALTGIANRKKFDQCLSAARRDAVENGTPMSLVLLDIDHFKAFNDRFGHHVGDEVLKVVAQALENQTKGRDTPARYGGEEFALILPETRLRDAMTVADGIRYRLASGKLTSRQGETSYGKVTVSAGAAQYQPGETVETLLRRADQALYAAKTAGRNCVCSEDAIQRPVPHTPLRETPIRSEAG